MTTSTNGKTSKKDFRKIIAAKLEAVLTDLQSGLKEKKFKAAIKRAGKVLANDLFVKAKKEKKKKKDKKIVAVAEEIGA